MKLKILIPQEIFLDRQVNKVVAEAQNGSFCILPNHVDFVAALVPGLLGYVDEDGREQFVAVDEGTLVKCESEVLVSTRSAAGSGDLGELQRIVDEEFAVHDERERLARSAAARLEAGLVRRFMDFEKT